MIEVASRELRNRTRALLEQVERGETVTITVRGKPAAVLQRVAGRSRWLPRDEFVRHLPAVQTDPELSAELAELTPDTTDDLPWP
ncbi:MAG: type II toxin-antitoxin system prevent-host-death family antitoxin [Nitriliruptor sp.]|uniref:type II toxin-antitoxin system Phd/YefM family antitoxin n=1 Tax=Nitriliruptor sp. TaxID=2448056 RepID=UPI0034A010D6